ncbi:hypothetical protein FACS1894181_02290 [Bacteroidia bacterium]|nr:hypothetical protein FACS1894181_02290 [Bacteroidia bacterium]
MIVLLFVGIMFSFAGHAQDFSTYESRKQWLLKELKQVELVESGKHGIAKALARLHNNPHDEGALVYLTNILDNRNQYMFDFPGVAFALCRYWDSFSPAQRAKLQHDLERLAKEDKKDGEGFLGHGTENHATIMWVGGYLFGQLFPGAKWANGMNSKQLMDDLKERMRKTFKNYYDHGYTEYLSTTYELAMDFPIEILLEFAKDPEMKAIAEAFMLYKWSLISLDIFEGTTLAPYGRMNTQQDHAPDEPYVAGTSYYNWLLFGWGPATPNVRYSHYTAPYSDATFSIYTALSGVVPDEVFFNLAATKTPFSIKTSASTFGHYGAGVPHMMMRNVYRDKSFAIGTGNFRWVPGGDYADHDTDGFNIVWSSPDRFNYLGCYHPYWYSDSDQPDRTADTWWHGNISPFQQTAHNKRTVITLFDIPDKDPWPNKPGPDKWAWRDGHANQLIKRGMIRYPKSIDEEVEKNGWLFLREGKTFVGIKPLKDYYIQRNLKGKGVDGFHILKSDHAQTGFIFEVGSEDDFGSFENFQRKLSKNKISINWDNLTVSYTDSKKENLRIQYKPGLPVVLIPESEQPDYWANMGVVGMAESVPLVTINGKKEIPYQQWPMIESPYINMDNSILKIDDGKKKITVDWTGKYPVVQRN